MVDKILEFNKISRSKNETDIFEQEILNTKSSRYIFLFAKYIKNANIELLSNEILKLNDKRYIHFFIRSFKNINYSKFIKKIMEFNGPNLLFYVFYDTSWLPEEQIIILITELFKIKDKNYLIKALYYYFNVLKLKNEKVFFILNEISKDMKSPINNVTSNNYEEAIDILREDLINEYLKDNHIVVPNQFSTNRYEGRNNMIPDIIVCHITSNYEKAINNFYNDEAEVSSHFIVKEDGFIRQIVNLKDSSWANGTSLNQDSDVYYKFATNDLVSERAINANYYTFSIEFISMNGDLNSFQYNSAIELMKKIINFIKEEYKINFIIDRKHIIGHNEVNPIVRTNCPGDKFPFERLIVDLNKWKKNI